MYIKEWFIKNLASKIPCGYNINYRHFPTGDLGSLDEIEIISSEKGEHLQFWGNGYVALALVDFVKDDYIIPEVMLDYPAQSIEIESLLSRFVSCL